MVFDLIHEKSDWMIVEHFFQSQPSLSLVKWMFKCQYISESVFKFDQRLIEIRARFQNHVPIKINNIISELRSYISDQLIIHFNKKWPIQSWTIKNGKVFYNKAKKHEINT